MRTGGTAAGVKCRNSVLHLFAWLVCCAVTLFPALENAWGAVTQRHVVPRRSSFPLRFVKNAGQMDDAVLYYTDGPVGSAFFTREEIVFDLVVRQQTPAKEAAGEEGDPFSGESRSVMHQTISLKPLHGDERAALAGAKKLKGQVNFFRGGERPRRGIPTYAELIYRNISEGVDMRVYGSDNQLSYDLIVHPGVDPGKVTMDYEGVDGLEIDRQGDLVVTTKAGVFRQKKPRIYQKIAGKRVAVAGSFELRGGTDGHHHYGFTIGPYDRERTLVIDPTLVYSSYLGGEHADWIRGLGRDAEGYVYVAGGTSSKQFRRLMGSIQMENAGNFDAFVTKLSPDMKKIVYSTYIGGGDMDYAYRMAVGSDGCAYITGLTKSTDFPTYLPMQGSYNGGDTDAFIVKLSSDGSQLVYSSYLGGTGADWGRAVSVDSTGAAYVAGDTTSTDFPVMNPYQAVNHGERDVFISKIAADGQSFFYSTYVGGTYHDWVRGMTVDAEGKVYATGGVWSEDFPVVNPIKDHLDGVHDIFIFILSADGSSLLYSTYYGGSNSERGRSIKVGKDGSIYVAGITWSLDFPVVKALQRDRGDTGQFGAQDAFVMKIAGDGQSVEYATYLGGGSSDEANDVAIDDDGYAYVVGDTVSFDFPVTSGAYDSSFSGNVEGEYGNTDIFFAKLSPDGQTLLYSTFFGGSADDRGYCLLLDDARNVYIAGGSSSADFPVTEDALDDDCGTDGLCNNDEAGDGILVKFDMEPRITAVFPEDGGQPAASDAHIDVVFDSAMNARTIAADNIFIHSVTGTVSYDKDTRTATIAPSTPLLPGTTYTVTVGTGCRDISGLPLGAEYTWSFTTATGAAENRGKCFIATAAYGSYLDPHVRVLRDFRDRHLATNAAGRAFIDAYYTLSPPVAKLIAKKPYLRAITRALLTPVIFVILYPHALIMIFAGGLLLFSYHRGKERKACANEML